MGVKSHWCMIDCLVELHTLCQFKKWCKWLWQGSQRSWNPGKVQEFENMFSRPGKVMEFDLRAKCPGKVQDFFLTQNKNFLSCRYKQLIKPIMLNQNSLSYSSSLKRKYNVVVAWILFYKCFITKYYVHIYQGSNYIWKSKLCFQMKCVSKTF